MGNATQTTKINCFRDRGFCSEATGNVMNGMLHVDTDFYDIERWVNKEIVTKPLDMPLGCVRYVRRINRTQKKVRGVRSAISNDTFCKEVDKNDLYMELVDGFDVVYPLTQEKQNKRNSLLNFSSELRKYFDDLSKENSRRFKEMKN